MSRGGYGDLEEFRAPGTFDFLGYRRDVGTLNDGTFALDRDTEALFQIRPDNIFLVKVSYWLNP